MTEQRRVKIDVMVSPRLLAAVDAEARAQGTNRSHVIHAALAMWCARQRRRALVQQYTMPLTPAQQEESVAWDAVLDVAATGMLVDAAGN